MSRGEVVPDLLPRLRAAAATVKDAEEALELARRHRNELAVQAVEEGVRQTEVARAAGLSAPSITKLLLAAEPDMVVPHKL